MKDAQLLGSMDSYSPQQESTGMDMSNPEAPTDGQDTDDNYLAQMVGQLNNEEVSELLQLCQQRLMKDRMTGTLSLEDDNNSETGEPATPNEGGMAAEHMQEIGR